MVAAISLALSLTCSDPIIINKTSIWNEKDQQTLESAKQNCKNHYKDAPCVKKFIKTEELAYQVICGA